MNTIQTNYQAALSIMAITEKQIDAVFDAYCEAYPNESAANLDKIVAGIEAEHDYGSKVQAWRDAKAALIKWGKVQLEGHGDVVWTLDEIAAGHSDGQRVIEILLAWQEAK